MDSVPEGTLTPSGLLILLFVNLIRDHPELHLWLEFWDAALPYITDAEGVSEVHYTGHLFNDLLRCVAHEKLKPYVEALGHHLKAVRNLELACVSAVQCINEGELPVTRSSLVGSVVIQQGLLYVTAEMEDQLIAWQLMVTLFGSFARSLDVAATAIPEHHGEPVAFTLSSALALNPTEHAESRDVEGALTSFHRHLDLRCGNSPLNDTNNAAFEQSKMRELAFLHESFGHFGLALEAQKHAFASERRRLVSETQELDSGIAPAELLNDRGMVGWLHHVLAHDDRLTIPPELRVRPNDILESLRRTAETPEESAEVVVIDLNESLDNGAAPRYLRALADEILRVYMTHWEGPIPEMKNTTLHILLSVMWFRFGKKAASIAHSKGALSVARASEMSPMKERLLAEVALAKGFELGNFVEGLLALQGSRSSQRFDEHALHTKILLSAGLCIQAHNFVAAEALLDSLDSVTLNKPKRLAKSLLRVRLLTFVGEHYAAYILAGECANAQTAERHENYWSIYFRLAGARALVLSRDPSNAIEARRWIGECLRDAKQQSYVNLVVEAAVLEARLFYDEGDYGSCHKLCRAIKADVARTPQQPLLCEWQLLYTLTTQFVTGVIVPVDAKLFQRALYTECGSLANSPRLSAVCLRTDVATRPDLLVENPMYTVLLGLQEGRLDAEAFEEAFFASYTQYVDAQNQEHALTSGPDESSSDLNLDQGCFLLPSQERGEALEALEAPEAGDSTQSPEACDLAPSPNPLIDLSAWSPVPPEPSRSPNFSEDLLSKRLRPLSGSPRINRKRRSLWS